MTEHAEVFISATTYNERFDGFVLSTFSGEKVRVVNGELKPA